MNNETLQPKITEGRKRITDSPLVSIITPVLNRVQYVEECILNILTQTYSNIEHIIVDGGSTDGTVEKLAAYQAKNPGRIRYISEPDNGLGDAVNKGWKMAKGEILGWIDVGDTYKPDAVQAIVEGFKESRADVVFGGGGHVAEVHGAAHQDDLVDPRRDVWGEAQGEGEVGERAEHA